MPYYSEGQIEEVRAANDIVDVISSYVHLDRKSVVRERVLSHV